MNTLCPCWKNINSYWFLQKLEQSPDEAKVNRQTYLKQVDTLGAICLFKNELIRPSTIKMMAKVLIMGGRKDPLHFILSAIDKEANKAANPMIEDAFYILCPC